MPDRVSFSDLATAAYCPRQLYYRRAEDDRAPPDRVAAVRDLAFRYPDLRSGPDAALAREPIEPDPATYRGRLRAASERFDREWQALVAPAERSVTVTGRDCRGVVHKVLTLGAGPVPSVVSPGDPPENGVWEPQAVRAVAAAKALSHREQTPVDRAFVEYPAHGVVRTVALTTRRTAAYRGALRTARSMDGPPPRLADDAKCGACDYRGECGVRTRSLRSLL